MLGFIKNEKHPVNREADVNPSTNRDAQTFDPVGSFKHPVLS